MCNLVSAARMMSDIVGIYGVTRDADGTMIFESQEGLNRYIAASKQYNEAVQQYIDATGNQYKVVGEYANAYKVYSDSMTAMFDYFKDVPTVYIKKLAMGGEYFNAVV